jgi:hypothetical protein
MFTESSFYHQSYEILKDMEPHMKDVTSGTLMINNLLTLKLYIELTLLFSHLLLLSNRIAS